jgi:hypothetical protein
MADADDSRALRGAIDSSANGGIASIESSANATNLLFGNATAVLKSLAPLEEGGMSFSFVVLSILACCLCMLCCHRRQGRIQSALARGACLPIKADPLGPIFSNSPLNKAY